MLLLISDVIACDIHVVHRSSLVYDVGCAKTIILVVLVAMIVTSVVILTRSDDDDDDDACSSFIIFLGGVKIGCLFKILSMHMALVVRSCSCQSRLA